MESEITTFEINKAEKNRLYYGRNRYNCVFGVATSTSVAIGFLLNLIGLVAKPQNPTFRSFCEAAILPSTVIGGVFFVFEAIQMIACWVPKANIKYNLQFDETIRLIEISSQKTKSKRLKVHSIRIIPSEDLIIFRNFISEIILPLSCFETDQLQTFMSKTTTKK